MAVEAFSPAGRASAGSRVTSARPDRQPTKRSAAKKSHSFRRAEIMRFALAVILSLLLGGCFNNEETTGTVNVCAINLYANYSPKNLDQCVDVCIKCERGTMTTCTTSCTLKGAR
jgi:hypothetical protein